MTRKLLPIISGKADGYIHLDVGSAYALINGREPLHSAKCQVIVKYLELDEKGHPVIDENGKVKERILDSGITEFALYYIKDEE